MKPMNGIQEELRHSLLEINNQCQSLRQNIAEFVNNVSTLPAEMVKKRLYTISIRIKMQTSQLHNSHDGKGVVFFMMEDTLLGIHWAENELSIKTQEDLKRKGYRILSPGEVVKMVEHLADGIDSGQFAEAVEWINQYEPSLV